MTADCASHPLLAGLDRDGQKAVNPCLREVSFRAGQSIWCEGQEAGEVLFILEGEVELLKETEFAGSRFVIGVFGGGSVIGEEAVSSKNAKRPESALAISDTRFLVLGHDDLEKLAAQNSAAALAILKKLLGLSSLRLSQAYRRMAAIF